MSDSELASLDHLPFAEVGGSRVTLRDALRIARLDFEGPPVPPAGWVDAVIRRLVIGLAAAELPDPEPEALRAFTRAYRQQRRLYSAEETVEYFRQRHCTLDDFHFWMTSLFQEQQLRDRHAVRAVESYFHQNSPAFDGAVLSELVTDSEDAARELALQVVDDGADFGELAARYSTAASRSAAGFLGEIRRRKLVAAESAAIFQTPAPEVVGPFPIGREFRVLRVHSVRRAELNDSVRDEIEDLLWSDWLKAAVRRAEVRLLLYDGW